MKEKQFDKYSKFYDPLYITKDYKSEVKFIDQVIKKYAIINGKKILSLGCGTCSHDILLAKKGYKITGVDMSSTMLKIADKKIINEKVKDKISLINSDIRTMILNQEHDLAMAMFNVIGYQTTNEDINNTLKSVSGGLKKNGIFFFDCWYMPAVLDDKPTDRIKEIKKNKSKIIRLTTSKLNYCSNTIDIEFNIMEILGKNIIQETNEIHSMRYWSLPEIEMMLNNFGFELIKACNYLDLDSSPSENNWNMFIIAKKK